ncbi:MAG: hypothetical protein MZV70_69205 [Desulfobacterales bacterium]|nr:hypothetical protein [Desulfobacterales bacterium]
MVLSIFAVMMVDPPRPASRPRVENGPAGPRGRRSVLLLRFELRPGRSASTSSGARGPIRQPPRRPARPGSKPAALVRSGFTSIALEITFALDPRRPRSARLARPAGKRNRATP